MSSLLDAAEAYASRGWPVFPVGPDKRPLTEHGFKDATTDDAVIVRLWTAKPDAGIGVPVPPGCFVLDVDPRNGGDGTLAGLVLLHDPLPATVRALTGGGGEHLWFRLPSGWRGKLPAKIGPGLDIRAGSKAYVVVPPSPHLSGHRYSWLRDPEEENIAVAPPWLMSLLASPEATTRGTGVAPFSRLVAGVPEGERDETIFRYACDLRRRFTPRDEAEVLVLAVARKCRPPFPDSDALIKLEQAWKFPAGEKKEAPKAVSAKKGLNMICAEDMAEEKIEWLWSFRIPKRSLSFVSGDPGLGKSHIAVDLAARLSSGSEWPDSGRPVPGATLFLSSEDGFADVLRPRLRIAGADLARIGFLTGKAKPEVPEVEFLINLHEDLAAIEAALPEWEERLGLPIRLLIVDPFLNHLGVPGREEEVRPLLARLAAFLRRTQLAAIGIRHLNKTAEKALLYRPGGLMAFTGAGRAEYIVGKDPHDETRRIFASIKSSLAVEQGSLAYQIVGSDEDSAISMIRWLGPTTTTAEEVVAADNEKNTSQRKKAETMLLELLGEGRDLPTADVLKRAAEEGIGRDSVYSASRALGVTKKPSAFGKGWVWSLTVDQSS